MTARIVVSCDGHRHGQPCRGALHTRHATLSGARQEAFEAGWRIAPLWPIELCPSRGHDEDAFACPRCHRTSWNPNDLREGYCGACHDWTARPRERSP